MSDDLLNLSIAQLMDLKTASHERAEEEIRQRHEEFAQRKQLEEARKQLAAERAQQMDEQSRLDWEMWARRLIIAELDQYTDTVLTEALGQTAEAIAQVIGEETGQSRREDQERVTKAIEALRTELFASLVHKSDAAAVVDLPAWPRRGKNNAA